jgi:hypothetical protein
MFHITLHLGVIEFSTNETFGVKHGIFRICVECILGRVANTIQHRSKQKSCEERRVEAYSRSSSEKLTHEGVIR